MFGFSHGRRRCIDRRREGLVSVSTAIHIAIWSGSIEALGFLRYWFNCIAIRISISVRFVGTRTGRALASAATKRTSAFVHQIVVWQGKSSATGCCGGRGQNSRGIPQLHSVRRRASMGCAISGMVHTKAGIVQQSDRMVVLVPENVQHNPARVYPE